MGAHPLREVVLAAPEEAKVVVEASVDREVGVRVGADVALAYEGRLVFRLLEHLRDEGHAQVDTPRRLAGGGLLHVDVYGQPAGEKR